MRNNIKDRDNANELVEIIRDIMQQEIEERDNTVTCIVESVNADGTLNLYVLPDMVNVINNVINQCRFDFAPGDAALLYKIRNRVSNSFVIAKYNAKVGDTQLAKSGVISKISALEEELQNITVPYSVNN